MSFSSSSHTGIILTAGGVVAGLVLLVIFVVSPLLLDLGAANLAIRQGRQELSNLQAEINSYRELSLGFARSAPEREVLQKMFPLREEMVGLVEGLETAVEGAGASSNSRPFHSRRRNGMDWVSLSFWTKRSSLDCNNIWPPVP